MYHEEKVIKGVLCWRGTPRGEWTPFTASQLTERLMDKTRQYKELRELQDSLDEDFLCTIL